jgi:hypothetical protein
MSEAAGESTAISVARETALINRPDVACWTTCICLGRLCGRCKSAERGKVSAWLRWIREQAPSHSKLKRLQSRLKVACELRTMKCCWTPCSYRPKESVRPRAPHRRKVTRYVKRLDEGKLMNERGYRGRRGDGKDGQTVLLLPRGYAAWRTRLG